MTKLYLVIPCYNEEEMLPITSKMLTEKYDKLIQDGRITEDSRIVFIDDGSKDNTWNLIKQLYESNKYMTGIKLSRNRGHQNALLCGLMTVKDMADAVISIDADLQDDINAFDMMLDKFEEGCDIVYGVRAKRDTDTFFKRYTAESYYKMLGRMGAKIVFNHADYRLLSKRALNGLAEYKEVNMFLRGIVPMIGYKSDVVAYERSDRIAGESKYPLKKMIALALEGVTSLSVKPIRMVTWMGLFFFGVSLLMLLYFLVRYFLGGTVAGWASIVFSVWAIGGIQLFSIGIIGEYIGKIYMETKQRPRYVVEEFLEK